MKIVHVCLSCFYIDGFNYQENQLVREHVSLGHDVTVIASTENYIDGKLGYVQPSTYEGSDGAKVIRLPYSGKFPEVVARKLRIHSDFLDRLTAEAPDVVMFHGVCSWEIRNIVKFSLSNKHVRVWYDTHTDSNNSMMSLPSKLLHKLFYIPVFKSVSRHIEKVLCISYETRDFLVEKYGYPLERCQFFPLGGEIISDSEYLSLRSKGRGSLGVSDEHRLFVQTGKMTSRKKLIESLSAFTQLENENIRFVIAGVFDDEVEAQALKIIESDARISFLGWCNNEELKELLCSADFYVQPGTQSATMQMSMCMRCAVIIDDVPSHEPYVKGNGWLLNSELTLLDTLKRAAEDESLEKLQQNSFVIAQSLLDYTVMARKLIED